ncbi:MAG: C25 family cysteine peptidase [bacterium]
MYRTVTRALRLALPAMLLPVVASAAPQLLQAGPLPDSHAIRVLEAGPERTVIEFEVGTFRLNTVDVDGQEYSVVRWEGGENRLDLGAPALPGFRESIVIPDDGTMKITVLEQEYTDFPNVRIAPSKGPITRDVLPSTVPWTFDDSIYSADAFWPANVADLGEPYILRDVRGVVVAVDPFRWNPATETLRVLTHVKVAVEVDGPGGANTIAPRPQTAHVAEFERLYERHFLNWARLDRYSPVGEVGPMLVVSADVYLADVQPYVDWKNQMGVPTTLVSMSSIGTTATQLKNYIQNVFNTDGLCFILLIGDDVNIPYYMNAGGASDPTLTLLAGSDSYPDAFVGRISAQSSAQVTTQLERLMEYERNPDPAGVWYSRGVAIASNEGDGIGDDGEADWQHAQNYRADLLAFTYNVVNELYDGDHPSAGGGFGGGGVGLDEPGYPVASDVSVLLNQGRGLVHYTGHGSENLWVTTGFSISNINALTNDNMLPHVVCVGCVNGQFVGRTCFAETWMRATNGSEPTGAIGVYASTVNQQWATPMRAQDEMVDLLCGTSKLTMGGLCFNGSCDMIDHYGSNGITEFKNWTYFGDPSLVIRTATPTALTSIHEDFVDASTGSFLVQTEPKALVALSATGTLVGSAYADAGGVAIVTFDPADLAGRANVTLTMTGFNRIPVEADLPVLSGSTGIGEVAGAALESASPNPFSATTNLSLSLDREQAVRVDVFDVAGRHVATVHDGVLSAGSHRLAWDGTTDAGTSVAAGTYFTRLTTADRVETRRLVRLR